MSVFPVFQQMKDLRLGTFSNKISRALSAPKKSSWISATFKFFFALYILDRGYREALDGRLCRPDSEQRPLVSNFITVAIVKLCCYNFTQIANFMIFFVSTISYRPIDLSLLKEFSRIVSFWKFYIFHKILPNRGHWLAILLLWL